MNNTALGAENKKEQTINFISEAHEKFYYEKLKEVRYQDVYHKALCYCLGISDDTRRNVDSIGAVSLCHFCHFLSGFEYKKTAVKCSILQQSVSGFI
jgi:hypothetical protein